MENVRIRKLQDSDYADIIKIVTENEKYNSEDAAKGKIYYRINEYYHDFFILESDKNKIIGIAYSYDFRINDLNSKIGIMMHADIAEELILQSVRLLTDYLFEEYPLNKLIYECEACSTYVNPLIKSGFIIEAVLKEYKYVNGNYVDEIIITIGRKRHEEVSVIPGETCR